MKPWLLLVYLALGTPVLAQGVLRDVPVATLQTTPATILTPDFIRSCTYIAHGTLNFKKVGEETLGDLPYRQFERLKGIGDLVPLGFGLGDLSN